MKKVLICIPSLEPGGAERFAVDLASKIDNERFEVAVAVTRHMSDSFLKNSLIEKGIRIVDLSSENYLKMLKKQLIFLRESKPDIVHTNIGSILHMMLACKLCNVPIRLYTVHNEAKLLFGKSCLKKNIYKLAFSFFDFVPIAICPAVKETIVKDFRIDSEKIPVVRNGVDIDRFTPSKRKHSRENIHIISVGTLDWIKNQAMTIRAVCDLRKKGRNVTLEFIGDGNDREKLQQLVMANKAENYITLRGKRKNVEEYLQEADIYVSASKTEGLPLSILEAMACGLPVVATAVGGTVDIVCDSTNGYIVPNEDVMKMEKALDDLILSKEKRDEFGAASRRIAEEWSLASCVREYENLYERKRD